MEGEGTRSKPYLPVKRLQPQGCWWRATFLLVVGFSFPDGVACPGAWVG